MKIRSGDTRIVIIFSNFVIKIPKVHLKRLFRRFFVHCKNGNVQNKINEHKIGPKIILVNFLCPGLLANWREYNYYRTHSGEEGLLPVRMMLLGFLEIQQRGKQVSKHDQRWKKLKVILKQGQIRNPDLIARCQYSIWKDKLYLHDYANPATMTDIPKVTLLLQICNRS